jgi:hypothetical protein
VTPAVSVIITHHLDRAKPALALCLEGMLRSRGVPFELILVSDTETEPVIPDVESPDCVRHTVYQDKTLNLASLKVNWAVKNAVHPLAKYLWLVSDDVVVSERTMGKMVRGQEMLPGIHNPMSNSDNGSQFLADWEGMSVKEDVRPWKGLREMETQNAILVPKPWVAFYCTMMPREVWDKVGELDARLDYRHNDQCYCIRAAQLGIPCMINFGAFALHFGDVTLPYCTTPDQLDECTRVFQEKYA